ncbi:MULTISPECIES: carbohydrate kinase family protein [Rhizobium]|uniref:Ribokinase n=2 Tax=Rhizobium TaxID=379 RepID=A0A120FJF6_9HYPH|nr:MULTISPECIES: carbohydrate kinase family protein [Rhizobium]KWV49041.1 ribokinase [Rhizobium altiplani]KWV49151.1 ribokinase [Rhizobium altiplani]KWV58856.1 ribokinase [Rhizobium altiplani]CCM80150.1 putative PfkB domain protein [Rhizobium mesoamericanum STM3625]
MIAMGSSSKAIAVIGNVQADLVMRPVAALPPPGEERFVEDVSFRPGGSGGITGMVLAAAGAPVRLFGSLGNDPIGAVIRSMLAAVGVQTSDITSVEQPTSITVALEAADRERSFLTSRGHMETFSKRDLSDDAMTAPITLLTGFFTTPALQPDVAELARQARQNGSIVLFDPGSDQAGWSGSVRDMLLAVIQECHCFLPNEAELLALTGHEDVIEALEEMRQSFAGAVVVKMGAKGCLVSASTNAAAVEIRCVPIEGPDTTGAGDSFNAGFALGLSRGRDWAGSARLGTAIASAVLKQPAMRRYLTPQDLERLDEPPGHDGNQVKNSALL